MSLSTWDPRKLLEIPRVYNAFQKVSGAERPRRDLVSSYVSPLAGYRVLEVGCGPATNLDWWPDGVGYVGCDVSGEYIDFAKRKFGDRGDFYALPEGRLKALALPPFDDVIAMALRHHLSDEEVRAFGEEVRSVVKPGGMLITLDPCHSREDSLITKRFTANDRGRFVRTSDEYRELLSTNFPRQTCDVRRYRLFAVVCQSIAVVRAFRDE